ncbi:hypothetical protein ABZ687_29985 [Streptomyces ardesiacus]
MEDHWTVGRVAALAGVSVRTLWDPWAGGEGGEGGEGGDGGPTG